MTKNITENNTIEKSQSSVEKKSSKDFVTFPGLCAACWKPANYYCTECGLVGYCCLSHMASHWKVHDELCTAVARIIKKQGSIFGKNVSNPDDWRAVRIKFIVKLTRILQRDLKPYERDLLLFPKHCSCYEQDIKKLINCKKCHQVWYCRDDPQHLKKSHEEWCQKLRFYADFIRAQASGRSMFFEMDTDMFNSKSIELSPKDDIKSVIETIVDTNQLDDFKTAIISQIASGPLTILYALNKVGYRDYKNKFVIHLIGAEMHYEGSVLHAWEYFFLHHLPDVVQLKIIMIGPELNVNNKGESIRLCSECQKKKRKLIVEYKDGLLYHEYVKNGNFTKPNIVCALNPGLHRCTGFDQKDTWPLTIKKAVSHNCPFIFTAYTSYEAPLDLMRVQDCAMVYSILPPSKNPFASLKPDRNFISDHEVPLIFKNYYVNVVTAVI